VRVSETRPERIGIGVPDIGTLWRSIWPTGPSYMDRGKQGYVRWISGRLQALLHLFPELIRRVGRACTRRMTRRRGLVEEALSGAAPSAFADNAGNSAAWRAACRHRLAEADAFETTQG